MDALINQAIADGKKVDAVMKLEGATVAGIRIYRWFASEMYLRISGSGVSKDRKSDAEIRNTFFIGAIRDWQVLVPDFGAVEGPFQITSLEYTGAHDGEVTFEIAVESAGRITRSLAP